MTRIAVILGSTRPGRRGEQVAQWVMERARQRTEAEFELIDLLDYPLPHLDEPLPPNMATILIGTPFCRTTIGPSPTMPPSGALPAPTCFATSTPPRATAKVTSSPAWAK